MATEHDNRGTSGSKPRTAQDDAARMRHQVDQDGPKIRLLGELAGDFYNGLLSKGLPDVQASFITQEYVRQIFEDGRRERDRATGFDK